ncbi:MAG: pitrilysin family protein [Alphaproteobacteria bacterium]|jgi:predicted Zn-dependent peptidase|nr:pitrilysin family protein [Alphaproteobacteria bacterium]
MSTAPGPRITTLANGLRVITEDMPAFETASVGMWVDAGARSETSSLNGISHLLEHMAFKGTERRSARDIAEEIEAVGGHLNAYTSREQTAYFARVLKDDLALAVDLLADILQHAAFDSDELERERAVVIQEIGQAHDTPDDIIFDHFQATAYPAQPLGRPVLGTADGVAALTREALAGYMSHHYQADRMVLSGSGRIDHEALVALAEDMFVALGSNTAPDFDGASYIGGDFRDDRDLEQAHVVLGLDGVAYDDDDYYVVQVLSTVLGGGMSSRLFQEVREKRGLAYAVYSFSASYVDGGLFGVYAGTGPGSCAELMTVVCDELDKVADSVTEGEVARARAQLKSGLLMSLESSSARCEQLARQLLIFGRHIPTAEIVERIDGVDAARITGVQQRLLGGAKPSLAAIGPVASLPDFAAIAGRFG